MATPLATNQGADPYVTFRRTLLTPERVRELSRLTPSRALFDALRCWVTILGAWTVVAVWPAWWSVLLAIPVVGTRYYALFIIGHDGLHRRVFSRTKHNDLFSDLFVFGAIGAITRLNNRNHISHHQHLASEADPDRHKHGCFNKTRPGELIGFLTGASTIFKSVRNVFGARPSTKQASADAPATASRYTPRDLVLLLGWQASLIGGLSWSIGFWAWPVLWLMPVYVFAFLGDNMRSFAEHSHPEPDALADQHRLITFTSNAVERTFVSPMHMNFHATHHLWPSIPYYNLPIAEQEMRALPAAADIEQRGSYFVYLLRYLRAMPLERCRDAQGSEGVA